MVLLYYNHAFTWVCDADGLHLCDIMGKKIALSATKDTIFTGFKMNPLAWNDTGKPIVIILKDGFKNSPFYL